jgi:outer membrane protein assembly factor BamB
LEWNVEGVGAGYASVAVVDGRIYTTGNLDAGQAVTALDAETGKILWSQQLTDAPPKHSYPGSRSTPTVDDKHLYVVTSDGHIVCLAVADGALIWRRDFADWNGKMMSGWGYSESPLIDGDRVVCTPGGSQGMVVVLNKATGAEIWAARLPELGSETGTNGKPLKDGAGYSSVMVSEGAGVKQYVQLVGRGLFGFRASDGEVLWRYSRVANATANIPSVLVREDYVFTSTAYGTGAALLKLSPEAQDDVQVEEVYWLDSKTFQNKHGGMVLVDDRVYAGHGDGSGLPICLNMLSGEIVWGPERARGRGETSLVYADGHVVMRREDGTVMLVRAQGDSFQLAHSFAADYQEGKTWAHPVIANGRLFLREQNRLMSYRLR